MELKSKHEYNRDAYTDAKTDFIKGICRLGATETGKTKNRMEKIKVKKMTKLEKLIKEIIGSQYFAVLNTLGEGLPYSNLVSFAVTDDLRSLVFVTERNTRKFRNMQENINVSLLV